MVHDAQGRCAAGGGVRTTRYWRGFARGALQYRQHDVVNPFLVDASLSRLRRCGGSGWRTRQVEGRRPRDREWRFERLSDRYLQGETEIGPVRRQVRYN